MSRQREVGSAHRGFLLNMQLQTNAVGGADLMHTVNHMLHRCTTRMPSDDRGPLRVMFVAASMTAGGSQTPLAELAGRLDRTRLLPELCCLEHFGTLDSTLDEGVHVLTAPDAPDEMADRVVELLTYPDRAAAMGRAGREQVIGHRSIGQTVAGYQDLVTGIYTAKAARCAKRRPAEEPVGVA